MELRAAPLLYVLATLLITFGGFSSLLLALRTAAGGRLALLDRFLAKTVLTHVFVLIGGALLPPVLALYGMPERWLWRVSGLALAAVMIPLLLTYPGRRRRVDGRGPIRSVRIGFIGLGLASLAVMLACVVPGLRVAGAAYTSALLTNFLTTGFAFVKAADVIIQQQPIDESRGP